jgi:SAM-dependent methyltransferase
MDLCEVTDNKRKHPWEIARAFAIRKIIKETVIDRKYLRILDVGCGDAYIAKYLLNRINFTRYDGIDINLSKYQINEMSDLKNGINFHDNLEKIKFKSYDLILLLDVIEHIDNDTSFIYEIVSKYMNDDGNILIAAPAYNFLFSSHDIFLGHFRRYSLKEMLERIHESSLQVLASGYLFSFLISFRFFLLCYERYISSKNIRNYGIGNWKHGNLLTKCVAIALKIDAFISISLGRFGFKLPGLTVWTLCKKQQL